MGRSRCCVGGCSNVPGNGISLHTFPKEEKLRKQWIRSIQMTGSECSRAGWQGPSKNGSANAQLVCSEHFELTMFTMTTRTKWSLGLAYRTALIDEAIPTLFGDKVRKSNLDQVQARPVVRKREVRRILSDYNQKGQVDKSTAVTYTDAVPDLSPVNLGDMTANPPSTEFPVDAVELDMDMELDNSKRTVMQSAEIPPPVDQSSTVASALNLQQDLETHSTDAKIQSKKSCDDSLKRNMGKLKHTEMRSMNTSNKKASCACPKCCVTTAVRGTQVNRRPPPIKRKTKGTETVMEHHITYSTSSTQYCDSDIADEKSLTPACSEVPPAPHLLAFPLPAPVLASTPARKKGRVVVESTLNKSFMSTSSWGYTDDEAIDPDYETEASVYSDSEDDNPRQADVHKQRKFLVFEDNLLELFNRCEMCHLPTKGKVCNVQGSAMAIKQVCECGHTRRWESQPKVRGVPAGNILLSAGILFSGCSPSKVLRIFEFINVLSISLSTFFSHQRTVLWPAIERVWTKCNDQLISVLLDREEELVVAGDGRSDSPGHSAKFGVYSMFDMHTGRVVAIELVQSNEVKSSYHMELEGLKRATDSLRRCGLSLAEIITDRHLQIQKWIRENLPGTVHSFDVWHIGKAVKKKLLALSKEKDCNIVCKWMKSITNHLYWSAASSQGEEGSMIAAKWTSVVNHVQDIHTGHGDLYQQCTHGPLEPREWLKKGSKAAAKMEDILLNKRLCKDIKKLSTGFQTSTLESFHSVINHFAPKMTAYSFHGQMCRQYLAALHFNENVQRGKKISKNGKFNLKIVFPKYKDDFSVKFVNDEMTFGYVKELLDMCIEICGEKNKLSTPAPPPLTSGKRKPTKVEVTRCLGKNKRLKY
ncbi:uncharacterized protein LOC128242077 isoform X1 [Mya arenaria]|uniref:uncharacterized protein LOC128242077 isoform X1 n=2 Tax=Mya arenaria TaxID=6604 RepID=UPI0022E52F46|nr:uncharacterized protein LOC128242077 isoform X1 [Mya arenaria]